MEPSDLLRYVVNVLESQGLRYFVTGSVAGTYYGEPRFTNDIDIVLKLPAERVDGLCRAFPSPSFYVSAESAREALTHGGQFNIIHPASGMKVDIILSTDSPYDSCRFLRSRRVHPADDYEASFASMEDVILKKLEYFREGGSDKHLRDIIGMIKISGNELDRAYVEEWTVRLGVESQWRLILQNLSQS